jgi:hypothetical protein
MVVWLETVPILLDTSRGGDGGVSADLAMSLRILAEFSSSQMLKSYLWPTIH